MPNYFNCYVSFRRQHQGHFGKLPIISKFFLNEGKKGGGGRKKKDRQWEKEGRTEERNKKGERERKKCWVDAWQKLELNNDKSKI